MYTILINVQKVAVESQAFYCGISDPTSLPMADWVYGKPDATMKPI
jgi:hypothetical protein